MIASDPDNSDLTYEQIAGLRPFAEVLPAMAESARRGPGRPKLDKTLEAVTLRLDPAIIERFRAQGADWRKRMARLLEKAAVDREERGVWGAGRFGECQALCWAGMGASRAPARIAMMKTRQRAASQARSRRKLYPAAGRPVLAAAPWAPAR